MILLDGKKVSNIIKSDIAKEVQEMKEMGLRVPHLVVIQVGNENASNSYITSKVKSCEQVGIQCSLIHFDANVSEQTIWIKIQEINNDNNIDGLIVQLPLPSHISAEKVASCISPPKDVDGFGPLNIGRMVKNSSFVDYYIPATPYGIILLLEYYKIETAGKNVVVIGRSDIVGTPISILLSRNTKNSGNATVTLCHSQTLNIGEHCNRADILIAAIGRPNFIKADMVKENAVVIDVGINRILGAETKSGYKLVGDVDFDNVSPKCSYITPVPGGVGVMTVIGLLLNTMKAYKNNVKLK